MPKPRKLAPWIVGDGPEPSPDGLDGDQKRQIQTLVGKNLCERDWESIELARRDFTWGRWAKRHAVEYVQLERRLILLAGSTKQLLSALSDGELRTDALSNVILDKIGLILWTRLSCRKLLYNDLCEKLIELESQSRRVIEENRQLSKTDSWQNDWNRFICLLATVYENDGLTPTAANSSRAKVPKPSPFVAFVRAIVGTLLPSDREHVQSVDAMAKAVSLALRERKHKPPDL